MIKNGGTMLSSSSSLPAFSVTAIVSVHMSKASIAVTTIDHSQIIIRGGVNTTKLTENNTVFNINSRGNKFTLITLLGRVEFINLIMLPSII